MDRRIIDNWAIVALGLGVLWFAGVMALADDRLDVAFVCFAGGLMVILIGIIQIHIRKVV